MTSVAVLALALAACGDDAAAVDAVDVAATDSADSADATEDTSVADATAADTTVADTSTPDTTAADTSSTDASDALADAEVATSGGRLRLIAGRGAIDLTPDGNTALLSDSGSAAGDIYSFDVNTGAQKFLTAVGDPAYTFASGLASNGRVAALHGNPIVAGVWTPASGWTDIASPYREGCDLNVGGAWDVSADGAVVVGFFWEGCTTVGFRWSDASGEGVVTPLALLGERAEGSPLGPVNRPTTVSDDGRVAAGSAQLRNVDRSPALWFADGTGKLLTPNDFETPGEVFALSEDGTIAIGNQGYEGFIWTEADGLKTLGKPANGLPADQTQAWALAGNGQLVFGSSGDPFFGIVQATVWTKADGNRVLQDLVTAAGVTVPADIILKNVIAASSDGSILLGTATDALGQPSTFVLELATSAYGL